MNLADGIVGMVIWNDPCRPQAGKGPNSSSRNGSELFRGVQKLYSRATPGGQRALNRLYISYIVKNPVFL
jgi:hypothetical protein